jgi:hypothetical protein
MIRTPAVILASLLMLLSACGKKPAPVDTPEAPAAQPPLSESARKLAATVARIELVDERGNVSGFGRSLHMPETTLVGQEDDVRPVLDGATEALIRVETLDYFEPGDRSVVVNIYILEGTQSFKVGEMKEFVSVEFAVGIEVVSEADAGDVWTAQGKSSLTHEDVDIPREKLDDLYARAIRESIHQAFEKIR